MIGQLLRPDLALVLKNTPAVPSLTPIYKTTLTTTTDETTSTFTEVDIGVPHPNRVIVLACYIGVALAIPSATVNGIANSEVTALGTAHEFKMMYMSVPTSETATITVTAAGSLRKAISVFVIYPYQPIPLDRAAISANTTTDANTGNLRCQQGGCLIYSGGQHATLGTFTTTVNLLSAGGTSNLTESVDAQLESAASYTAGFVTYTNISSIGITMAESTSGQKRLHVMIFSPPYAGHYPATV